MIESLRLRTLNSKILNLNTGCLVTEVAGSGENLLLLGLPVVRPTPFT